MRKTLGLTLAALALTTAACGSTGSADSTKTAAKVSDPVWPTSGQHLSHYKGMASYDWRKNLLANKTVVDDQLDSLGLDQSAYDDLLNTCSSISGGVKGGALTKDTRARFDVNAKAARALIAVAKKNVC